MPLDPTPSLFRDQNHCARCGSIDVDVPVRGMPMPDLFDYVAAYDAATDALPHGADDVTALPPGNRYLLRGCVAMDDFSDREGVVCRACGYDAASGEAALNLAVQHHCHACGSISVTVFLDDLPELEVLEYVTAYDQLTIALSRAAFPNAPRTHEYEDDEDYESAVDGGEFDFWQWYDPSQGRGIRPPGNEYRLHSCIPIWPYDARATRESHCRDCGTLLEV